MKRRDISDNRFSFRKRKALNVQKKTNIVFQILFYEKSLIKNCKIKSNDNEANKMNSTLLVIDMQNDFRKGASAYSCEMLDGELIKRVKQLIELCRQKNIPVVYTQHTIKEDKSNAENGEPADVRACIQGTEGWKIINELEPKRKDNIVLKHRADGFFESKLAEALKNLNADAVIVCGVWTNNCVRATAEAAYARNYKIVLVSDCCGANSFVEGFTSEQVNDFTLKELKERTYDSQLLTLDELKNVL